MGHYEFRYFLTGSAEPVREVGEFEGDQQASAHAASELLQMPARAGVEVWCDSRLVYERRRQPRAVRDFDRPD